MSWPPTNGKLSMASDSPTQPSWIAQQPSAFDIVAAYYPESEPKGALRLRPCLVLDVLRGKNTGNVACRVVYGTKTLKYQQRKHLDIIVQNSADIDAMGLSMATRFVLDPEATVDLPWTTEFFGCWDGHHHPKIGTLLESYVRDYAYCMAMRQVSRGS